ncbi:amidase [Variovorax terrae]|uniref:Amidase n=1 Tax=Variovorax terrae TaxID=2923278 RepID=A0A9X1VW79_9BURK|nr:amidase [Variovorax terrae]MCJ0763007.1 amidase [Variovorax terrae]
MLPDLHATRQRLLSGQTSAPAEIDLAIAAAQSPACAAAFVRPLFDEARAAAAQPAQAGRPLGGLSVSVKDLFDIAGQTTAAGSAVLAETPAALHDSPAVARLRAAGAALIGRTNMTEFAFSGVGVNPHHGTPANACDAAVARIPGGSSSGAAVSVATGAAFIGLGSDTGGSIRIPAALNGIVGFKNTARLVPTGGALPLSPTLDTVCAMTRSVRDAITAHELLAARTVTRSQAPLPAYRLAVARTLMLDGLEPAVARAFERTLQALRRAGARIDEIALPELAEVAGINATGGFSPPESYAWHRPLLERDAARYDPRVAARIQRGAAMAAWQYLDLVRARRDWIARMETALAGYDAVLSPTVPVVAPPIAEVAPGAARDEAFFRLNGLLLRNPSAINLLDGCALSLPCQAPGELPVGLMVWQGALRDDTVLNIALQIEQMLQKQ